MILNKFVEPRSESDSLVPPRSQRDSLVEPALLPDPLNRNKKIVFCSLFERKFFFLITIH